MAVSNLERVGRGLDVLKAGLSPYILRELKSQYTARWWKEGVESALRSSYRGASATLTGEERFARLDVKSLLEI